MKKPRLSERAAQVLRQIAAGADPYDHIHGRSAHGGMTGTLLSLRKKELIETREGRLMITQAGIDWLHAN
jgi:hypothetical protein